MSEELKARVVAEIKKRHRDTYGKDRGTLIFTNIKRDDLSLAMDMAIMLATAERERDEARAALALVTEKFGNTIAWHDDLRSQPHDPDRECAWQMGEAFDKEDRDALAAARALLTKEKPNG